MRRSAPPSRRCVANEWRSVCGLIRSCRPARVAAALTALQACCRASRPPRSPRNSGPPRSRGDVAAGQQPDARPADPGVEVVEGDVAHRHQSLLVALADHADETAIGREVLAVQAERFADPQSRRVQQLEERTGTHTAVMVRLLGIVAAGRFEEPLGLGDGQRLGQQALGPGQLDVRGDVAFDQPLAVGEPVEPLQRRRTAAKAGRAPGPHRRDARVSSVPPGSPRRHPGSSPSWRAVPRASAKSPRSPR